MKWRLIEDGAHSGASNMARDEALLLSLAAGALPTLRFYEWQPACLSLGRFQRIPASLQVLAEGQSAQIVRRPTGGRAVWHEHEITYSAVFPLEMLPLEARGVTQSYRWLSEGFLRGLQLLGIEAQLSPAHKSQSKASSDNCFVAAAQCDTTVDNRKLIGAAQCRITLGNRVWVLQHGSILWDVNWNAWSAMLGNEAEAMRGRVVTLRDLGLAGAPGEVKKAIVTGLSECLDTSWEIGRFSKEESERAGQLEVHKYGTASWNLEGRESDSNGG